MTKIKKFTSKGVAGTEMALPSDFIGKPNMSLLAQAVYVYRERSHIGLRNTKTRAEINKTTKKIYKQKGTGGARHGSKRANVFVGGGVALGPRAIRRVLNLSNNLKNLSQKSAFSLKAKEGQIVAVSGFEKIEKTKDMAALIAAISKSTKAKRFTFVFSKDNSGKIKFMRNISFVTGFVYPGISAYEIWNGGLIVMDESIFEVKKEVKKVVKKEVKKEAK